MDRKVIITIGREFGGEGHEIGKVLAERLSINMYDKDLMALAAKKSGIAVEHLVNADENIANRFLEPYLGTGFGNGNINDKLFQVQAQIIRDIAAKESCIIIGRLADFILREEEDCIKVFIFAPFESRVDIIQNKHHISGDEAKKLVKKMDRARNDYYAYYSNRKWDKKEGKDILLNRAKFGVSGCVDILEAMARSRMQLQ